MPLDGITTKFLSHELSRELTGARIEKINQPDSYDIYIKVRNNNQSHVLIASANPSTARFHITADEIENPPIPLRFCTILRKYLSGGRILSIQTPGYERIFRIEIQTMNEIGDRDVKVLVIEIMGRYSNIILLNENGRIIDSALHVDEKTSRVREILPTRMYLPPPLQDKSTPDQVISAITSGNFLMNPDEFTLEQFLLNHIIGISPLFVQEICLQSKLSPGIHVKSLDETQSKELLSVLFNFMNDFNNARYCPTLFYNNEEAYFPIDFHAFSLHTFPYKKSCSSISLAMDEFYTKKANNNYLSQKKAYLVRIVTQKEALLARKIIIHNKDLEECKSRELQKKYGDLILSNLHRILPGQSSMNAVDYYDENMPELQIPLQTTLSGSQNAQRFYKRYNKLKSKFESVSTLLENEKRELDYFNSIQVTLSNVDSIADIEAVKEELYSWDARFQQKGEFEEAGRFPAKKKKKTIKKPLPIPPRRFMSSDDFEIIAGRNNIQNDQLTMKIANKDDLWFHIQKAPGAHVIIRTNRQKPSETTIEEAAMIAAWYSKSSDARIQTKVIIDYCMVKNVWKPKGSSPGNVLYRDFESINVKTVFPANVKEIK